MRIFPARQSDDRCTEKETNNHHQQDRIGGCRLALSGGGNGG